MKSILKLIPCALFVLAAGASAATLPPGFSESVIATGISNPTAMAFAPDGRLFICQQNGQLRVVKNDVLLATPFLTVSTDPTGERGLLGVAFDPDFANNQRVYIYYTVPSTPRHNRVSHFTANGDVAATGSETVILELDNLSTASNHNGGAIHFGLDGKLYVAVGENANRDYAQVETNRLGKILRINPDGSIPGDNPTTFTNASGIRLTTTGLNRAIWALGLRNPFTFAFQPGTPRMLINDVGESSWEEINEGVRGANYGWPNCEGACSSTNPNLLDPIYQYSDGCAIVGGAFYNPAAAQFPSEYNDVYFFADLCSGWIRTLPPVNGNPTFATGLFNPVDLAVSADGSLYYLERGRSSVSRVRFTSAPNVVTLTFVTQPSGLQLTLDANDDVQPPTTITTPYEVESVVGTTWTIDAPSPQQVGRRTYNFVGWSDSGAQTHVITTPGADTTYRATYRKGGRP